MWETGLEQLDQIRLAHLIEITKDLDSRLIKDSDLTIDIKRRHTYKYSVFWQITDGYGGIFDYIFTGDKIKEIKSNGSWMS